MKYFSSLILSMVAMLIFTVSPVLAGNSFIDLISGSKIYFSHIATEDGWGTEIAVLNPTSGPASGTLTSYDTEGKKVGSTVSIALRAHGRYQADVGSVFVDAGEIAYIVLTSEVLGLKGYSKFYTGRVRASIMASAPTDNGIFTKIEQDGWTGIAFINTASVLAKITLTAYNNNGDKIVVKRMEVDPGHKVLGDAEILFEKSLARATYICFHSDQGVVGFFLNGSSNNAMLDGSKAL